MLILVAVCPEMRYKRQLVPRDCIGLSVDRNAVTLANLRASQNVAIEHGACAADSACAGKLSTVFYQSSKQPSLMRLTRYRLLICMLRGIVKCL